MNPTMDGKEFFEMILTRTDDSEFVAVARYCSKDGVYSVVESGDKVSDLWKKLVSEQK